MQIAVPVIRVADVPDAKLVRSGRKARVQSTVSFIGSAKTESGRFGSGETIVGSYTTRVARQNCRFAPRAAPGS